MGGIELEESFCQRSQAAGLFRDNIEILNSTVASAAALILSLLGLCFYPSPSLVQTCIPGKGNGKLWINHFLKSIAFCN